MKKRSASLYLLALYGMMTAALLILTAAGAGIYARVLQSREANTAQRLALSYVQSQASGFSGDRIRLADGPEGTMLCLREAESDYETRIYLYGGALRTEFCPCDRGSSPESSRSICPMERFSAEWEGENLLRICTDRGESLICCYGGNGYE